MMDGDTKQFAFDPSMYGLPDSVILGPNGKPQEGILRQSLELTRSQGNAVKKDFKPLKNKLETQFVAPRLVFINRISDPEFRAAIASFTAQQFIDESTKRINSERKSQKRGKSFRLYNWELLVLKRYAPDLWDYIPPEEEIDGILEKKDDEDFTKADAQALLITKKISERALAELEGWAKLPDIRKSELACVYFALGFSLDIDILNMVVATRPELLEYYSLVTTNEYNLKIASKPEEVCSEVDVNESYEDGWTPENYYQAIEDLIAEAKSMPRNASIAPALLKMANGLNDWFEKNPQQADISVCISKLLDTLYTLGYEAKLDGFAKKTSTSTFKSMWYQYIGSIENERVRDDTLVKRLISGEEMINHFSETIDALKVEVKSLSIRDAELVQQAPESRAERRQIEESLATLRIHLQERKNRLYEVEDEAILSLLPPGSNLEDLECVEDIEMPSEDSIHEAMRMALQRVYSYIDSGFVATLDVKSDDFKEIDTADDDVDDIDEGDDWSLDASTSGSGLLSSADQLQEDESPEVLARITGEDLGDISENIPCDDVVQSELKNNQSDDELTDHENDDLKSESIKTDDGSGSDSVTHEEVGRLQSSCLAQLNQQGYVESHLINQAIMELLENDKIEIAIGLACLVEDRQFSKDILPADLLKGAYYGCHNWSFGRTFNKSQNILSSFSPATIDQWGGLREAGKAVPYLIFASCFQPAVFGGNYSNAPSLLNSIKHAIEGPASRLIEDTINLANRDKTVSLINLRSGGEKAGQEKTVDFSRQVGAWAQRIKNSNKGYAPILKAQSYCLEKGIFADITEIIRHNNSSKFDVIKQFVSQYQDRDATDQLLDKTMIDSGQDYYSGSIHSQGKSRFYHKVGELIEIAQGWMGQFRDQSSEVEEYCRKLSTLLPQAISQFRSIIEETSPSLDRRAGAKIVVVCLENLRRVIDGNEAPVWEHERVKVWMHYPEHIIRLYGVANAPAEQFSWYLSQIEKPVMYSDVLDLAMRESDITLGYLMYMFLRDGGDDRKRIEIELKERSTQHRLILRRDCRRLESQVDNAVLSLLINPDKAESLIAELEEIQESIGGLSRYSPRQDIVDQLQIISAEIARKIASKLRELEDTYRSEIEQIRASISGESVPDEWVDTMEAAISDANLPVVDEMLDELQTARREGQPIRFSKIQQVTVLHDYLASEDAIYQGINGKTNYKDVWNVISSSQESCYGLDFSNKTSPLKKVIESFCCWNNQRPAHEIDQSLYAKVAIVFDFIGLDISDKAFKRSQKSAFYYCRGDSFSAFYIKVKAAETRRPFPIFGDDSLPVIIAYKKWSPEQLEAYIQSAGLIGAKPILISAVPLSNDERNQFANYFKCSKSTILHIDLTMALFLGSLTNISAENSAIRNFLWLSLPWTYFNPYVAGGTTFPPPNEMRYGRRTEINRLLEMNNGHAIVFGGRQLGKSTIVQQVRNNFNKPNLKQLSFYHLLDKNMDRMSIKKTDWENARRLVWEAIYSDLVKGGLIKNHSSELSPDQMSQEVEGALLSNKEHKIIVIFDEIDPILNVDNAHDFGIFRGIRELVSKPDIQGRFKLIIAGLENVKRFENSPNYPLQQLGGSLQVSIMSTQDALHLIKEPLFSAGYKFDNAQVANRILAITNRHPGIIQVFCHELIASLSTSKGGHVGSQIITDDDITNVQQKQEVIDLIRTRFDMTLNLDRRYLIIIYGLLNEKKGTRPFSAKEAHMIATQWLPDEFQKLGVKQFEAFLTELCGLGVLKAIKEGQTSQYALRNTNILKLIGDDEDEIIDKLQMALDQHSQSSPLDRHGFWPEKMVACPITFRDEKEFLGSGAEVDEENQIMQEGSWKYTTTIIVGSNALGSEQLASTLPHLYETERVEHAELKPASEYEVFERYDADFDSPEKFQTILRGMLETKSKSAPTMLIVHVTGNNPIAHFLGMLDAAHSLNGINMDKNYPVRVVFSMSPHAYWQWLLNPDLTDGRELLQPFIKLAPWNTSAIAHLLDKLGMVNTPSDVRKLMEYSEGWYLSLNVLCQIKNSSKSGINELSEISGKYVPMNEINLKQAKKFIQASGINDVPWAEPLISAINDDWNDAAVSLEEIQLSAQEIDNFQTQAVMIKPAIDWLTGLNILRRVRSNKSNEPYYSISPSIVHALDVVNVQ